MLLEFKNRHHSKRRKILIKTIRSFIATIIIREGQRETDRQTENDTLRMVNGHWSAATARLPTHFFDYTCTYM